MDVEISESKVYYQAFNWEEPSRPRSFQAAPGWRFENRSTFDIGDYMLNVEETLRSPEFIFRGIRKGAEEHGGKSIDGLCYVTRVWYRYRSEGGQPVRYRMEESERGQNTYAIYIDDNGVIMGGSFMTCDWFGVPNMHEFKETLYNMRGDA